MHATKLAHQPSNSWKSSNLSLRIFNRSNESPSHSSIFKRVKVHRILKADMK